MKWPLTLLAILLVSCSRSAREAGSPQSGDAELQSLLNQRAAQAGRGVAVVAGILDENGRRIIIGKGEQAGAVDGDTLFEIGSITKAFTGQLLAEAVSRNEVKLDDSISKFLPASVKTPERNGRQITLLDLATHSAALTRMPDNMVPKDAENPYADYSVTQMYGFLSDFKPARDIGAKYEYSNYGAGLLGHILALKAGTNYEALVLERICQPLGMTNTLITLPPALKERLAPGHDASGAPAKNWDLPTFAGAGALRSTVNDLLKFLAANLELVPSELSPAMRLAQQPQRGAGAQMKIGLCWHISEKHDAKIVWHNGGTGGYHSFVGFNPATQRAVVLLANSARSFDDIGFHLLESEYPLAGAEPAKERVVIQLKPERLDRYVGRYELVPGAFFNLRRDGSRLLAQLTGQSYFEIYPESETEFFYRAVDAQITFVKDDQGRVTEMVLHQNGRDSRAKRIR